MDKSYRFTSDTEPTKEQLDELMLAVVEDVKERALKAEAKFKALQIQAFEQVKEIWISKQKKQKCPIKPKLIIIAGPNGSGKTSVTNQILKHEWVENCMYINPDIIAQEQFGDWNSPQAVLKAAQFSSEQRENCLKHKDSFIFETVFSTLDKVEFLQKAKDLDYFIRLFFVGTNHPAINASRIAKRVMEGGHDVPISKIISRYYKSINNACLIPSIVDRLYVYDNSLDYTPATLLFRANNGILEKVYTEVNDWAMPIFNTISHT